MQVTNNVSQTPRNINRRPNFKGNFIVNTMDAMERGGLFASFTVQDMLGTNIPRPIMGLRRNKKENQGKKNTTFALKETIREFTTGPSMFLIPGAMLFGASKIVGNAVHVPEKYINGLGEIFKNAVNETNLDDKAALKKEYYQNTFKNILKTSTGLNDVDFGKEAEEFATDIISLEGKHHKNPIQKMVGKPIKDSYEDAFSAIEDKFVSLMKKHVTNTSADFTAATIDTVGETSFDRAVKHMVNYGDDALKHIKSGSALDATKSFIDKFNVKRIVTRFGLNAAMATAVIAFLAYIPKLYNISKENPGLAGLEVKKAPTNNQTPKQEGEKK